MANVLMIEGEDIMPTVSIIIPAHNVSQYIEDAIKSLQEQTYKDWEALVINDGSTDNTNKVVEELALLDNRILLVNQAQSGVSAARNKGISLAKGKVLTFLDGDDLWKPSFLSNMLAVYEQGNDLVLCDFQRFYPNNVIKDNPMTRPSNNILLSALNENINFCMGTVFVKKEIVDKYGITFTIEHKICEDVEFILKLLTVCKCSYLQKKLMLYRKQRPGSATETTWDFRTRIAYISAIEATYQFIEQNYTGSDKERILSACNDKLRRSIFRYIWKLIRYGYYEKAIDMLKTKGWYTEIALANKKTLNTGDRLRHAIIHSENHMQWKIISGFKKNKPLF